ncbi:hypothetical protein QF044_004357 [Chryseobacterium sp. W4I1]|nr:hypothetical protein [Chryseobacterium sp. W4I1]
MNIDRTWSGKVNNRDKKDLKTSPRINSKNLGIQI